MPVQVASAAAHTCLNTDKKISSRTALMTDIKILTNMLYLILPQIRK